VTGPIIVYLVLFLFSSIPVHLLYSFLFSCFYFILATYYFYIYYSSFILFIYSVVLLLLYSIRHYFSIMFHHLHSLFYLIYYFPIFCSISCILHVYFLALLSFGTSCFPYLYSLKTLFSSVLFSCPK
jgi:hypothetical protein